MHSHKDVLAYNDNPILMTLDSTIEDGQKDLPIAMYESIFATGADGSRSLVFSPMPYKVEAGEAESVTLDAVANTRPDDSGESVVVHTYLKQVEALRRLSERVAVLQRYLRAVQTGKVGPNARLLRLVSDVVARVPTSDAAPFRSALLSDFGDTLLTTLVASLTTGTAALDSALTKLEQARDSVSSRRSRGGRGRGGMGRGDAMDDDEVDMGFAVAMDG
jgi:COP9 signalosome complex subunit 6